MLKKIFDRPSSLERKRNTTEKKAAFFCVDHRFDSFPLRWRSGSRWVCSSRRFSLFLSSFSIRSIVRDIYLYHTQFGNLFVIGVGTALDGGSDSKGVLDSVSVIRALGVLVEEGKSWILGLVIGVLFWNQVRMLIRVP